MEADRTFYVDVALSVKNREGKQYWKCSLVENNKNVANWVNSVVNEYKIVNGKKYQTGTNSAEAFTILKTVFWLADQNWKGKVQIFTDNMNCVKVRKVSKKHKSKFSYYLSLAHKTAISKGIQLNIAWIKGIDNPADYYSRH